MKRLRLNVTCDCGWSGKQVVHDRTQLATHDWGHCPACGGKLKRFVLGRNPLPAPPETRHGRD